jgi:hypothetical protein
LSTCLGVPIVPSPAKSQWRTVPTTSASQPELLNTRLFTRLTASEFIADIVNAYFSFSQTSVIPSPFALSGLQVVRAQVEDAQQEPEGLEQLLDTVSENTTKPFEVPHDMSPNAFHTLYTGQNLRWEFVGMFLKDLLVSLILNHII